MPLFCALGTYTLNNSLFDVGLMAVFTIAGYLFRKGGCEPAPMLLGFVVGPMLEENLRRALLLSGGDATVFVTRPISATLLASCALLMVVMLLPALRRKREVAFEE